MRRFLLLIILLGIFGCVAPCPKNSMDVFNKIDDDENVTMGVTTTPESELVDDLQGVQKEKLQEEPAPTQPPPIRNLNPALYGGVVPMLEGRYVVDDGAPTLGTWTINGMNASILVLTIVCVFCIVMLIITCCIKKPDQQQQRDAGQRRQNQNQQKNQGPRPGRDSRNGYRTYDKQPVGERFELQQQAQYLVDRQEPQEEDVEELENEAQERRDQGQPENREQEPVGQNEAGDQNPGAPSTSTAPVKKRRSERIAKRQAEAATGAPSASMEPPTEAQDPDTRSTTSSGSARSADVVVFVQTSPESHL